MFCKNCNYDLKDGASFCPKCGTKQDEFQPAQPQPQFEAQPNQQVADTSQPFVYTPQPEVVVVDNGKKNIKKANGFKRFLGYIMHLVLTLFVILTVVLFSFHNLTTPDSIRSLYEELGNESVEDVFDDPAFASIKADSDIQEEFEEFFYESMSNIITVAIQGNGDVVDVDRVMSFVEDHKAEIEKASGNEITDKDMQEMQAELEKINEEFIDEMGETVEDQDEDVQSLIEVGRIMLNPIMPWVTLAICIVLVALIVLLFGKNLNKSLGNIGWSALTSGFFFTGVSNGIKYAADASDEPAISNVIEKAFSGMSIFGIVAIIVGIVLIVASIIYKSRFNFVKELPPEIK